MSEENVTATMPLVVVNQILAYLAKRPFEEVYNLIGLIKDKTVVNEQAAEGHPSDLVPTDDFEVPKGPAKSRK